MNLLIDNRDPGFELKDEIKDDLEKAISQTLAHEGLEGDYEVSLSFVESDEIRELNKDYRDKDAVTDVLSFYLFETLEEIETFGMLGDIVICVDRARDQAEEFGHSLKREMMYLTVHSTLHLLGYDHTEEEEKEEMRSREKEIMKELGVFKSE